MSRNLWPALALPVLATCSKLPEEVPPPTGAIVVQTLTSGHDLDPDGYTATLDAATSAPVASNGSVLFSALPFGIHTVELTGEAPNCTVSAPNPRDVEVTALASAQITFEVTCLGAGTLVVQAVTSGDTLDFDGYAVFVDGSVVSPVTINGSVAFSGLEEGLHTARLSGEAVNCRVSGPNPRTVDIPADATEQATFAVTCFAALFDRLAFTRGPSADDDIYIMNPDGSDVIRLTDSPGRDYDAAFSPDGTTIAFRSERDGDTEIYIMDVDGNATRLTSSDGFDGDQSWSPDGRRLVFRSERDGNSEIYVMNANGTNLTRLTDNSARDDDPTWSPNGSQIAFRSDRDGNNEIYVMDADGSNVVRLTTNSTDEDDPVFSPDGTQIAFVSDRDDSEGEIYVMDADGSNVVRLTDCAAGESHPAWSPDATRIAFTSDRDGNLEIYLMDAADGANLVRLTTNTTPDDDADWSPTR